MLRMLMLWICRIFFPREKQVARGYQPPDAFLDERVTPIRKYAQRRPSPAR